MDNDARSSSMTSKQEEAEEAEEAEGAPTPTSAPEPEPAPLKPPAGLGIRHLVIFMLFLCLAVAYSMRVTLNVAILDMVANCTGDKEYNNRSCTEDENAKASRYDWNDHKFVILGSFFWGYVVTQVPAGIIAQRLGGKPLLFLAVGLTSVMTLFTHLAADDKWGIVCGIRIVQGLAQGLIFPSVHTLLSKWAPPAERGRFATFTYAGAQVGTFVTMPLAGLVGDTIGWPYIFYIFGAVGAAWTCAWFFLGADSPATHRWCSAEERAYIETSQGDSSSAVSLSTPWKSLFTSLPFLSLIIVHAGQNWGFWTLLTVMPTYMDFVFSDIQGAFRMTIKGLLSALPYLVMWLLSFVFIWTSDVVNRQKLVSLTLSRKIFNTIAHWGPAATLLGVGYVESSVAVVLLTIAVGLDAATYVGFQVNHIDLSPNFAGSMMGVTNGAANIMSIIGPLVVDVLVDEKKYEDLDPEEKQQKLIERWRIVFYITSAILFLGNLAFVLLGSAKTQPWNTPKEIEGNDAEDVKEETEEDKEDKLKKTPN